MQIRKDMQGLLKIEGGIKAKRKGLTVWGFITTLSVETEKEALEAFDSYDDRSLVENKQYRELKQGYFLKHFSGKTKSLINYHIYFSLIMINVISLYKITNIEKHEGILEKGIRLIRRECLGSGLQVIVYADNYYSVLEFLEFMNLLGRPPTGKLDNVRMRFLPW